MAAAAVPRPSKVALDLVQANHFSLGWFFFFFINSFLNTLRAGIQFKFPGQLLECGRVPTGLC